MANNRIPSRLLFVRVFAICSALAVPLYAHAQESTRVNRSAETAKRYVPASVKAAPDLQCKLHAQGSTPASGLTVFTDGDGYARFHAIRASPASWPQMLTCIDEAGRTSSYLVDLASDETFADRQANIANERGIDRPALTGDPLSYTQAQLSQNGYGLRPNPAADPAAYASWREAATKPGRMLYAKRPDKHTHTHTVTSSAAPPWIGAVMTGSAPYKSITATFQVPTAISGAEGTTSTLASFWPGLGGFNSGSGLIQAGVTLQTTPTAASYTTWREYCCGDGDSNGYGGAFVPSPGDKILAQAWYCDANGQEDIGGGFGCSYLYDYQSGAVFSCTTPKGSPNNQPCWSVKALTLCSVNPTAPNCMTLGTSAEFILENQSGQLSPPTDQFPKFTPTVAMSGAAVTSTGVSAVDTDPTVTLLTDYAHGPPCMLVALAGIGTTSFTANPCWFHDVPGAASDVAVAPGTSPTSWYTTPENVEHIAYVGTDQRIHELFFFVGPNGQWSHGVPGAASDVAVAPGTSPTSWYTTPENVEHIAYVGTDQRIHELFFFVGPNGQWFHDVPGAASDVAVAPGTSPTSWYTTPENVEHIAYVGTDQRIHELFFFVGPNGQWSHGVPGAASDVAVDPGTSPTSWYTTPENVEHIAYVGTDQRIHELFFFVGPNGQWSHDVPGAASDVAVAPGTSPTSWYTTPENVEHIAYVGTDQRIHELFFFVGPNGQWSHDVPGAASDVAVAPGTSPTSWYTTPENVEHIAYVGTDQRIRELFFFVGPNGQWFDDVLGAANDVAVAPSTSPTSWYTTPENVEHIAYVGTDPRIHELFYFIRR